MDTNLHMHNFPEIKSDNFIKSDQIENGSANFRRNHSDKDHQNSIGESQPWPKVDNKENELEQKILIDLAFKDGYKSGFKDGGDREKEKIESLSNAITQAIFELKNYRVKLLEQAEESILKLVSAITRKLITKEASIDPDTILSVSRNALKMVVNPTNLTIRINPKNLETLNQNKNALESIIGKNAILRIESDATISVGGCILETDFGDIDARIEAQMQMIEKALNNAKQR